MILERTTKQPRDIVAKDIDYTDWLHEGETIASASATAACLSNGADSKLTVPSVDVTSTAIRVWVAGGTDGETYKVTATVLTTGLSRAQQDDAEFIVLVSDA